MAEQPVICIRDVHFCYDGNVVLDGIDLTVRQGEAVALAGPNGAGKTTLLKLITGLLRPLSGSVEVDGQAPAAACARARARGVAVVPQESEFLFPYRVAEVVRMGRTPYLGFWGFEAPEDIEAAREALAFCDMTHLADRFITQLSGGERQRAIIARALAQRPRLLVLDEPARSLDPKHTQDILRIVRRIRRERELTVVMVTHDLNRITGFADRLVLMRDGRIITAGPPADVLTPAWMKRTFGIEVEVLRTTDGRPMLAPLD